MSIHQLRQTECENIAEFKAIEYVVNEIHQEGLVMLGSSEVRWIGSGELTVRDNLLRWDKE